MSCNRKELRWCSSFLVLYQNTISTFSILSNHNIFILRIIIPYFFEFEGIFWGLIDLNPAFSYQTFYPKIMHILHYIPFKSILCIRFVDLRMLYFSENCFSVHFLIKKSTDFISMLPVYIYCITFDLEYPCLHKTLGL